MTAWDVTTYGYSGGNLDISGQTSFQRQLFFRDNGLSAYVVDDSNNFIRQYTLSTAWDISTGTLSASFDVSTQDATPIGLFIGDSGAKMYVLGGVNDAIFEYDLSTPWVITSASFNQSQSIAAQENQPRGLYFKDDGTKCFLSGRTGEDVNEYTLSTAWDISTLSFVDSFSFSAQTTSPGGLAFGDSGSSFYVTGPSDIYQYDMTSAWDVSTASYVDSLDVSGQDNDVTGLFFRPNGASLYISGNGNQSIFQYNIPVPITSVATMAGTSTFTPLPANITADATMSGVGVLSGAGSFAIATKGRAVDEASAGGTSVRIEPANPSGNT